MSTVVEPAAIRGSHPTLAVIICNYNHGALIPRAIEAVVNQSRPADEIILVDDCSTDDSVSVIRGWCERYPTIRFLHNERNLGFFASFEKAIATTQCDYVYSGAADDRILPGFFEGAMRLAETYPSAGFINGQYISVDPQGRQLSVNRYTRVKDCGYLDPARYLRDVLMTEPATHSFSCATIYKRGAFLEIGGYRSELGSCGDTFAIQAIGLRFGICYWPHPAMEWTVMPGSLSQTTRSDPLRSMRIVDRAAELMTSERYRSIFPQDYVDRWVRGFRQSIVHDQLSSIIEANQVVQSGCIEVAKTANFPIRIVLELLRFVMRAVYYVTFRVMRFVVVRRLTRMAAEDRR